MEGVHLGQQCIKTTVEIHYRYDFCNIDIDVKHEDEKEVIARPSFWVNNLTKVLALLHCRNSRLDARAALN